MLLSAAPEVWAQAIDVPNVITSTRGPATYVRGVYAHQFETNVENSAAEFSLNTVSVNGAHRFEFGSDWFFLFQVGYTGNYYDFQQGTSSFLRWDDIHRANLFWGAGWKATDDFTIVFLGLVQSAGESGARLRDSTTGGGGIILDYAFSDTLSMGLFLAAQTQLEDQVNLIPVPTINWQFADDWRFNLGIQLARGQAGIGPEISYETESWFWGVGASYQNRRFRLDSDSGQPSSKGVGDERSVPVIARLGFHPTPESSISVVGGAALAGQLRSGRQGGGKIFKEDYKAAPIASFQATVFF